MKTIVFDIESNQLDINEKLVIFCIVAYCIETGEWKIFEQQNIKDGIEYLKSANRLVGHNIIGYDLPALKINYERNISDTFICSQMLFCNERSSHSLESWGEELGYPKVKFEQWGVYNEKLKERCITDVKITYELYKKCRDELKGHNWKKALDLEHKVYQIYTQHSSLWRIDVDLLQKLLTTIQTEFDELEIKLYQIGKTKVIKTDQIFKPFIKNGKLSVRSEKLFGKTISGECCLIDFEKFNPGSTTQMVEQLLLLGWKPQKFTDKNKPSFRDDPLIGVREDVKQTLSRFRDLKHQLGVLKGFKEKVNPVTGEVKMFAKTCGTNTARFTHQMVVNIQKEFKPLFIAKPGYKLVGCDAASLEARIEGYFTSLYDNGAYKSYLLETEDLHSFNAKLWGLERQQAKSCFYALSYGAGPKKLSQMMNVSEQKAKDVIKLHYETWPGLTKFIKSLEDFGRVHGFLKSGKYGKPDLDITKKPYLVGIDGRRLYVRDLHSLKNTMIQSTGAIAMKVAYCNIYDFICQHNLDAKIVMFYHDEFIVEIIDNQDQIKLLQSGIEHAILKAGQDLGITVPLIGESKVGNNWMGVK